MLCTYHKSTPEIAVYTRAFRRDDGSPYFERFGYSGEGNGGGRTCRGGIKQTLGRLQLDGVVGRQVGYFSGTASDRRLPTCTGR
jgi:hypothetical protein